MNWMTIKQWNYFQVLVGFDLVADLVDLLLSNWPTNWVDFLSISKNLQKSLKIIFKPFLVQKKSFSNCYSITLVSILLNLALFRCGCHCFWLNIFSKNQHSLRFHFIHFKKEKKCFIYHFNSKNVKVHYYFVI